jgi:hypothetical protein
MRVLEFSASRKLALMISVLQPSTLPNNEIKVSVYSLTYW